MNAPINSPFPLCCFFSVTFRPRVVKEYFQCCMQTRTNTGKCTILSIHLCISLLVFISLPLSVWYFAPPFLSCHLRWLCVVYRPYLRLQCVCLSPHEEKCSTAPTDAKIPSARACLPRYMYTHIEYRFCSHQKLGPICVFVCAVRDFKCGANTHAATPSAQMPTLHPTPNLLAVSITVVVPQLQMVNSRTATHTPQVHTHIHSVTVFYTHIHAAPHDSLSLTQIHSTHTLSLSLSLSLSLWHTHTYTRTHTQTHTHTRTHAQTHTQTHTHTHTRVLPFTHSLKSFTHSLRGAGCIWV